MFSISLVSNEDVESWDNYVTYHKDASPYHRYAWLHSISEAYKHDTLAWQAKDANNKIVGVLPTVYIKPPMGKGKLSALPFCDVGGVLADNQNIANELMQQVHNYCHNHHIETFEHRQSSVANEENSGEPIIAQASKVRMLIAMPETAESMFNGFKSKLRSQIRKAEKNGLTATIGNDQAHLDGFYEVFARNMRDLGSPVHSKAWFKAISSYYGDNVIIANVYKDQQVIGAGIVLTSGKLACIPWASTNADFNRLAPNMLLYWTLLAKVADSDIDTFDFGRSTPNEGTFKFKQQWGATPLALNWQTFHQGQLDERAPSTGKSKRRGFIEGLWKKLPVDFTVAIGPKIRKYISL